VVTVSLSNSAARIVLSFPSAPRVRRIIGAADSMQIQWARSAALLVIHA
jgi:hypothetical protein